MKAAVAALPPYAHRILSSWGEGLGVAKDFPSLPLWGASHSDPKTKSPGLALAPLCVPVKLAWGVSLGDMAQGNI